MKIAKYKSWSEVPKSSLVFWLSKTPQERLKALDELVEHRFWIQSNQPHARPLPTIHPIVKRRGR